jgi:hypothetical protein
MPANPSDSRPPVDLLDELQREGARQRRNAEAIRRATASAARAMGLGTPKPARANPERDAQVEAVKWLRRAGLLLNAAENERRADSRDPNAQARFQAKRRANGITPGWPDLTIALDRGRCLFVEMKSATGTASERQRGIHDELRALGHVVVIARTIPEIHRALRCLGVRIALPPGYQPLPDAGASA